MTGLELGSKSHAQWKSNCAGLLACLLVFLLPAILLPQEKIPFFTQLLGDTKQKIYEIRYGKDGLPEGNLYEADTLHTGEEPVLAIRSEQKKNVYFKGYVGGTYANGVWEPLSGESYRGTSSGMLEWLAKKNFDPLTQTAQYYALGDEEDNRKRTGFMWKIREHRATTFMRLLRWKRSQPAVRHQRKKISFWPQKDCLENRTTV